MTFPNILVYVGCIIAFFVIGKILLFPIKKILKLVINTVIGGALIYIINLIGASFGFAINLNLLTSFVVGILGIPGVILLIILKLTIG